MKMDLAAARKPGADEVLANEALVRQGGGPAARVIVVVLLTGLMACAPNRAASDAGQPGGVSTPAPETAGAETAASDTLRGTVAVVGAEPANWIVLRPAAGGPEIPLRGESARPLRRLSGVTVQVEGRLEARVGATSGPGAPGFVVQRFAVQAVDGIPAVDGVLDMVDDVVYLIVHGAGRIRIAHPPAALRGKTGAWVWLAGPLDGEIAAFGVIREADGD